MKLSTLTYDLHAIKKLGNENFMHENEISMNEMFMHENKIKSAQRFFMGEKCSCV